MDSQERPWAATLARRVSDGANALDVAEAVGSSWRDIDLALIPVLGQGGVAALFKRSLHLASAAHPWLVLPADNPHEPSNLTVLKAALAQRPPADAAAGGGASLDAFTELLGSLIGPSLTERMLRPVWKNSTNTSSAQDSQP